MSVGDNLIGAVSQHKDPADSNSQDFSTAYYVKGDGYVDQAELSAEANLINYHNQNWYMDSGASHHFRKERGKFYVIEQRHLDKSVKTADDKSHRVDAIGSSSAATHSGTINLSNVLCVPALKQNLMSVGASADTGHTILFTDKRCLVQRNDTKKTVLAVNNREVSNGLSRFADKQIEELCNVVTSKNAAQLWHERFRHLHYAGLQHLSSAGRVRGLLQLLITKEICHDCFAGRQHRERFPKSSSHRSNKLLQLIH